jgi:hypothetical protein
MDGAAIYEMMNNHLVLSQLLMQWRSAAFRAIVHVFFLLEETDGVMFLFIELVHIVFIHPEQPRLLPQISQKSISRNENAYLLTNIRLKVQRKRTTANLFFVIWICVIFAPYIYNTCTH